MGTYFVIPSLIAALKAAHMSFTVAVCAYCSSNTLLKRIRCDLNASVLVLLCR